MKIIFILLSTILNFMPLSVNYVNANERPSVNLGSVDLELGMPKKIVLEYLEKQFMEIKMISSNNKNEMNNNFLVIDKYSKNEIGQIIFKNEKIVYISKNWGHFENNEKAFDFVNTLFSAFRNTMEKDTINAVISTNVYSQPTYESKRIEFVFGSFKVLVIFVDGSGDTVDIQQILQDYQNYP